MSNAYLILFFLGFVLAIGLLAYASLQVAALDKRAAQFSKSLKERYSRPFTDLQEGKEAHEKQEAAPPKE